MSVEAEPICGQWTMRKPRRNHRASGSADCKWVNTSGKAGLNKNRRFLPRDCAPVFRPQFRTVAAHLPHQGSAQLTVCALAAGDWPQDAVCDSAGQSQSTAGVNSVVTRSDQGAWLWGACAGIRAATLGYILSLLAVASRPCRGRRAEHNDHHYSYAPQIIFGTYIERRSAAF